MNIIRDYIGRELIIHLVVIDDLSQNIIYLTVLIKCYQQDRKDRLVARILSIRNSRH